jgi:hypothetical protein
MLRYGEKLARDMMRSKLRLSPSALPALTVLPVLTIVALTIPHGSENIKREISKAALAPYLAFVREDATGLCADFVPAAAERLGNPSGRISDVANCVSRVRAVFAQTKAAGRYPSRSAVMAIQVDHVQSRGRRADVWLSYGRTKARRFQLELTQTDHGWHVVTQPFLLVVPSCLTNKYSRQCPTRRIVLVFFVGVAAASEPPPIPPPPAVTRAGGRELQEFEAGSRVMVTTGCLACHRIGLRGNSSPGPELTHVGSKLSERQIEHAILDPTAPMPSFKNLPRAKLALLVKFLSLLR